MEPTAKRPRLAGDTPGEAGQLTEASQSNRNSIQPLNHFEGCGLQNTGSFTAGRDVIIQVDKWPNTNTEADKRQVLFDSLQFDEMGARELNIKKAHAQTCIWFLNTSEYINWTQKNAPHNNSFLWIKGKPGAGKSTLMKFLLGRLRSKVKNTKRKEVLLSFFFNARGHDREKTTTGLYRSLLAQLLKARPDLRYVLDDLQIGHRWTTESLKSVFGEAVQGLGDDSLIFLIDALDECEEAQIRDMVSFLSGPEIIQNRVRICLASRHYPHITVRTAVDIILESQGGHDEDIESYLNSVLMIGDSPLAEQIRHDLRVKASGVFMWVVLVVGILNKEYDAGRPHTLRERIQQLPKDLHDLFRDILTRDNNNMNGLLLCMQWILFAQQPLTPKQLYFAILSGMEPDKLEDCHLGHISEDDMKRYILDNSKGLAESTRSKKTPTVQFIHFIHESVRDFFLKNDGLSRISSDFSTNTSGRSHDMLKQCCQRYMSMKVVSELMESSRKAITQKFPFLEYVNRGMLYHAEQAQINGISQQDFLKTFPRPEWVKHHNMLEKAKLRRYTLEVSLYYILAEAGMSSLIQAHSTRQSCFEIENERYGLPILAASATKSIEAINTMLEIEAERLPKSSLDKLHSLMPESLNIQCAASRNFMYDKKDDLLHQLMEHGNKKIALLYLLTHECNINVRDPQGQTIPISPIERGFSMPARVLAQEGSDMPATGTPEGTRLHLASSHGHTEVAKLLVACGADLSAVNKYGQTPLHVAVSHGYIEVVKLLVVYNTNLSAVGNSGQTPLHVALLHGHPEVAKLLIVCDADLSAVNKYGQTPLHIASLYGYATVVNLLVSRGADLSAVNKDGRTPLHLASLWGNTRMVILLLGYGADPSATDTTGQTSSQLASMGGYTETVRLLREHGANLLDTDESG